MKLFHPKSIFMLFFLQKKNIYLPIYFLNVTEANVEYVGSITIDSDLLEKAGISVYEKVLVVSNTSGARLETYAIEGPSGSGVICMNGAAAHLIEEGEEIIVIGFELSGTVLEPKMILVDSNNAFKSYL